MIQSGMACVPCERKKKMSFFSPPQAVIIPCGLTASLAEAERVKLLSKCKELEEKLKSADIRAKGDYRDNYSPGWKFNHWELKVNQSVVPRDFRLCSTVIMILSK